MKPSSKTVMHLRRAICCAAMILAAASAVAPARAAGSEVAMNSAGHGPSSPHVFAPPGMAHRNFRHGEHARQNGFGQSFALDTYFSGSFANEPYADEGEGFVPPYYAPPYAMPPYYPPYYPPPYVRAALARQACVVPRVIELSGRKPQHKLPKVVYGSPAFCPPPVTATR